MKAAVIREFGDVDVLKYEDIATPKPKPGHILIKVLAAGVNRLDHYLREGSVVPELPFPHILGTDAVGEVFEVGAGVICRAVPGCLPSLLLKHRSQENRFEPIVLQRMRCRRRA